MSDIQLLHYTNRVQNALKADKPPINMLNWLANLKIDVAYDTTLDIQTRNKINHLIDESIEDVKKNGIAYQEVYERYANKQAFKIFMYIIGVICMSILGIVLAIIDSR